MRPGGHLATAVVLSGTGYGVTGSAELAAGCFAGAFMIDVDHYLDYLTVEGQWRRPGPAQFLRYYFAHRYHRLVLPLHSIELMGALVTLAVAWPRLALVGYLTGALLHLLLDVLSTASSFCCGPSSSTALPTGPGSGSLAIISSLGSPSPPTSASIPPESFSAGDLRSVGSSQSQPPSSHCRREVRRLARATTSKTVAHKSKAVRQGRAVQAFPILGAGADAPHHARSG